MLAQPWGQLQLLQPPLQESVKIIGRSEFETESKTTSGAVADHLCWTLATTLSQACLVELSPDIPCHQGQTPAFSIVTDMSPAGLAQRSHPSSTCSDIIACLLLLMSACQLTTLPQSPR